MSDRTLNDLMSFGHVVASDGDGNVTDDGFPSIKANEIVYLILDNDGQSLDDDYQDVYDGWSSIGGGFTGQHGYKGPTMHTSEYIGGRLERHIRENAGFYVAVVVDGQYRSVERDAKAQDDSEDMTVGWTVLYRPFTEHDWSVSGRMRECSKCHTRETHWDDDEYPNNPCMSGE